MRTESRLQRRRASRALAIAWIAAGSVCVAFAADPPKKSSADKPAKKPAASAKPADAPATAPNVVNRAKTPAVPSVHCKAPTSVEPVCAPPAPQSASQKFNTFEDIYSAPASTVFAPSPDAPETAAPDVREAPAPTQKSE